MTDSIGSYGVLLIALCGRNFDPTTPPFAHRRLPAQGKLITIFEGTHQAWSVALDGNHPFCRLINTWPRSQMTLETVGFIRGSYQETYPVLVGGVYKMYEHFDSRWAIRAINPDWRD